MYKIYTNDKPLYLVGGEELSELKTELAGRNVLYARYTGKSKSLFNYFDSLEKGTDFEIIVVYFPDLEKLFKDFLAVCIVMIAAGGLVEAEGKYLAIFRRGFWDLPKGKAEKGETIEETAIREVQEETGLSEVRIIDFLMTTYHVFRHPKSGHRCLKVSEWYRMESPKAVELVPQEDEDIEKAVWIGREELLGLKNEMYKNIIDVVDKYFNLKA